jgi:hypothetical protein
VEDIVVGAFKDQFWREVKKDLDASDAMHRVPSPLQNRVVWFLQAVSDPAIESRLMRGAPKLVHGLIPPRKALVGLASRLATLGNDLQQIAKLPGYPGNANRLADFGNECLACSKELKGHSRMTNRLGYKGFWKSFPIALLCRELVDSNLLTFDQLQSLVTCGDRVHRRTDRRAKRSVERQYKHFLKCKSKGASQLESAAWPIQQRKVLDKALAYWVFDR